jgi:hypothetical protein
VGLVRGETGPQGPAGTNGNITAVANNGTSIVSNPTTINFTGAGVTVTESPTGVAQVNIPGGSGGSGGGTGNVTSVRFIANYTGGAISSISGVSNADFVVSFSGTSINITYTASYGHPISFGCYGDNGTIGGIRTMRIPTGAFNIRYTNPGAIEIVGASASATGSGAAGTALFNVMFG